MAGYAAIRDAIGAGLDTLPTLGVVHRYRRYVVTADASRTAFQSAVAGQNEINFADVDWTSGRLDPSAPVGSGMRMLGPMTFTCRFYKSLNDDEASGLVFAQLLEDALHVLAQTMVALTPRQQRVPVALDVNEHRLFGAAGIGNALVHYGEIRVTVDDQVIV